ncbi:MAG TPA: hypothetical protein VF507_05035, partial [Pyrinomonadaceae bacterium]
MRTLLLSVLALSVQLLFLHQVEAHPATGIVVDGRGQIYFSDLETVWKIDAEGRLSVFRPSVGRHVHELALDGEGNVYGADNGYDPATKRFSIAVWKMTPAATITYLVPLTENPPKGAYIYRDREGNSYFVDQNNNIKRETLLLKRTPDGRVFTLAGGAYGYADGKGTQARFSSVGGMAFGPDGALYLTDGSAVRKVSTDGTVTTLARDITSGMSGDDPVGFGGPTGIAADKDGSAFVADFGRRRVLKVTADGKVSV